MYYLSTFCCTCLKRADKLINLSDKDSDGLQYADKFKMCSLNFIFHNSDSNLQQFMCQSCCQTLKSTYKFMKMCLNNSKLYRGYICQLKSMSEENRSPYFDVNVEISSSDTENCAIYKSKKLDKIKHLDKTSNNSEISCKLLSKVSEFDNNNCVTNVDDTQSDTNVTSSVNNNVNVALIVLDDPFRDLFKTMEDTGSTDNEPFMFSHSIFDTAEHSTLFDTGMWNENVVKHMGASKNRSKIDRSLDQDFDMLAIELQEHIAIAKSISDSASSKTGRNSCETSLYPGTNYAFETFAEMQHNAEADTENNNLQECTAANALIPESLELINNTAIAKTDTSKEGSNVDTGTSKDNSNAGAAKKKKKPKSGNAAMQQCKYCDKVVVKGNFKRHLFTHSDIKPYKCEGCNSSFRRLDHMKSHFRRHHANSPTLLSVNKSLATEREKVVRKHKYITAKNANALVNKEHVYYECSECLKIFGSKKSLKAHTKRHDNVKTV